MASPCTDACVRALMRIAMQSPAVLVLEVGFCARAKPTLQSMATVQPGTPTSAAASSASSPSSQPAASPSSHAVSLVALPADQGSPGRRPHRSHVNSEIERLLAEQKRIKEEKKTVKNELRNAQRRRQRLKHKARLLSQMDLLEIMNLRVDEQAAKQARTDESRSEPPASASASTSAEDFLNNEDRAKADGDDRSQT